jgi:superfamily II DNA or RNA helicase
MSIPVRFQSAFSPSVVQQFDAIAKKLRVRDPLFFRGACTANVIENERRTFNPLVVLSEWKIARYRCSCSEELRFGDLCRHLGMLIARACDPEGAFIGDRFESSLWRAVGFTLFSEGAEAPAAASGGDAREQLLRRLTFSAQEDALVKRGAASPRLLWESSAWYRWSKDAFVRYAETELRLAREGNRFALVADALRLPLSPAAVEQVLAAEGGAIASGSGFELRPDTLTPTFRIDFTPERALRFTPMVIDRQGVIHHRSVLPRFGRWFFMDGAFVTPRNVPPMFAERSAGSQGLLFEARPVSGMPFDRETLVAEERVLDFIDKHRDALALMPQELVPEPVRNARPMQLGDEVIFDFAPSAGELLDAGITFRAGDETITVRELAAARKEGIRALVRGNSWVDVSDPQFAWIDSVKLSRDGRVLLTKLELMRIRGVLRGKAVFRGDAASESVFALFDAAGATGDAPSPAELGMDLYGYQQTGYRWLWLLQQNDFGALLCDDMGLGKTHQAMALIRALAIREATSFLIVCPTSLIDHWRDKLARYLPDLRVDVHHGSGRELRRDARAIVTSYGVVRSDIDRFRALHFDLLVADEVQTIKNRDTATHQALRAIHRRVAVGLTGTPVENHTSELETLVEFVMPGYLPRESKGAPAMLRRLIQPFVLRRTKGQVLTELPPKIIDKRYCELMPEQTWLYKSIIDSRGSKLREAIRAGARIPYIHVFAALNYLKQICNHPLSVGGGLSSHAPSGKWSLFCELLEECLASGLKVVVFSQYVTMLKIIEGHLDEQKIGWASIKGDTRDRGGEVRRFHDDPDCRVFTASLRAAGLGIDLTAASVVIHYDRWWNQAREDQATDRVHRLGQNKGVQVIKLITRGTVEEKIDLLIEQKAQLAAELVTEDDPTLVKQFTPAELEDLLVFD